MRDGSDYHSEASVSRLIRLLDCDRRGEGLSGNKCSEAGKNQIDTDHVIANYMNRSNGFMQLIFIRFKSALK